MRIDYKKFIKESQAQAKEHMNSALANLNFALEQIEFWEAQAKESRDFYEECKMHYEDTLTWENHIPQSQK